MVRASNRKVEGQKLIESLEGRHEQEVFARNNKEFPVVAGVKTAPEIARFGPFKRDTIDVDGAGRQLVPALRLMEAVGWH